MTVLSHEETWPYFDQEQIEAVSHVLKSGKVNYWTGKEGKCFEQEYANFCGVRHGIAVSNGTVALELALYSLGVTAGDEVIVPSRTFIATASAVVARGARPVVADVDKHSQNVTAETVSKVITKNTRAIIVVHLAGWPCDMDEIRRIASQHNLFVIEDCSQAHGAEYKGQPVGSLGDIATFSFCQDKIITTGGEGGMVVTNNKKLWERAWQYKDHGKSIQILAPKKKNAGKFQWVHDSFGSNFRMTEMQAVIGRIALKRLPSWVNQRQKNATVLRSAIGNCKELSSPLIPNNVKHSYYKFYCFIDPEKKKVRPVLQAYLQSCGVPVFTGSCSEIYLEKAFPNEWKPTSRLPVAKQLGETSLMLQVHPTLKGGTLLKWAQAIQSFFGSTQKSAA